LNGKKRVVFYTENYVYGGLERFLFDAIDSLPAAWDAVLLHNDYPGFQERLKARVRRPVECVAVPIESRVLFVERWSKLLPRTAVRAAARLLERARFERNRELIRRKLQSRSKADVFHAVNGGYPGAESCAAAVEAAFELGVPRRIFSLLSTHDPAHQRVDPAVEKALLAHADVFVANSESGRRSLVDFRGFPPQRVMTISTGIAAPKPDAAAARELRSRWLGDGSILVGTLGAVYPLKGHRYLIEALPSALARVPGLRLAVVGDGESLNDLKAQAKALGVADKVAFPGYFPGNAVDALAAFDVLAHPTSQTEGLPYSILEAMALGKPIVATTVGGVPEAVEHGISGLLVPPAQAAPLADALAALAADPALAKRLGDEACRRQRERFSLDRSTADMIALYEGGRPAAASSR
jgi:glycosyltransferase involved in cell wall biosynthesis